MKHDKDNQWLDPLLSGHLGRQPAKFDLERWSQKHPGEARLLREGYGNSGRKTKTTIYNVWRFIMESKVTRYSAAAVVALAVAFVLFGPFGTPGNGIVLADVQQRVAGIETMVIRGQKTFTRAGEAGEIFEFDGMKCQFDVVKYFSKQHGHTEEGYVQGKLVYRITFNLLKRQTLIVIPPYKKYVTFTSTEGVTRVMEDLLSPNGVISLLLESGYKELGRSTIDGVEVEGFEFEDAKPVKGILPKAVFDIQQGKGKVWIGIKEQLPVRIEGDVVIGKSLMTVFNELNLHEVNVLDRYNVELDASLFNTDVPEGYTEFTIGNILHLIPVEAKAGLAGLGIIPAGLVFWKRRRRTKRLPN